MTHSEENLKKELTLGFDDNLGLPLVFLEQSNLKTKPYHDLSSMLSDFKNEVTQLIFTPAGTLPYINRYYELIAQASFRLGDTNRITAHLVTAGEISLSDVTESKIGRINPYCTTSFWGLLIYLLDKTKKGTTIDFIETNGFQDLLIKTANKEVDVAMVWDIVSDTNPDVAKKTHSLGIKHDLPTPVIIANTPIPESLINKITHFKSATDVENLFFNGFMEVDLDLLSGFREQMALAATHFNLCL